MRVPIVQPRNYTKYVASAPGKMLLSTMCRKMRTPPTTTQRPTPRTSTVVDVAKRAVDTVSWGGADG